MGEKRITGKGFAALTMALCSFFALSAFADSTNLHGSLSNRYKFRATGSQQDQDLETLFTLDIGNPIADRFSGALQGAGIFDLDGQGSDSTFSSPEDALAKDAITRLYYAYFDAKELGPIQKLRAGRQHNYELESLYFDGVLLESAPVANVTFNAYGGVPVHLFETISGFDPGDWLAGGGLKWNPLDNFQTNLDYTHLRDSATGFRSSFGNRQDDLFGASMWWDPTAHLSLSSRFTSFSDQVRDLSLETALRFPDHDFSLRANVYSLLKGYDIRVLDLDAFGVIGTYKPYTEASLTATKGIGKHFSVDGGYAIRMLQQDEVANAFNHGFQRLFLTLGSYDLPIDGFSLTATGDYYRGKDSSFENNTFGATVVAGQELYNRRLSLSAGTAYYLYRYNIFVGNESSDVQT